MGEVKLKKFEVFATQLVDCVIEIQAETRDDAEVAYQAENPTHRIERILTAVPSVDNPNNTRFL